ncbi:hypothetical protein ACFY1A_17040 [Streptomyces sp. NPDC001520]|uniref:hypothetical protein n=1 Tax=Streptomyces sp. NPDC001520 TaxID=3364581 RepID=UPI00369130BE
MSTRHVVEHALRDYGYSPDVVPQIVNNLLNEHAHELADRLEPGYQPESGYDRGHAAALSELRALADISYPEVKS